MLRGRVSDFLSSYLLYTVSYRVGEKLLLSCSCNFCDFRYISSMCYSNCNLVSFPKETSTNLVFYSTFLVSRKECFCCIPNLRTLEGKFL